MHIGQTWFLMLLDRTPMPLHVKNEIGWQRVLTKLFWLHGHGTSVKRLIGCVDHNMVKPHPQFLYMRHLHLLHSWGEAPRPRAWKNLLLYQTRKWSVLYQAVYIMVCLIGPNCKRMERHSFCSLAHSWPPLCSFLPLGKPFNGIELAPVSSCHVSDQSLSGTKQGAASYIVSYHFVAQVTGRTVWGATELIGGATAPPYCLNAPCNYQYSPQFFIRYTFFLIWRGRHTSALYTQQCPFIMWNHKNASPSDEPTTHSSMQVIVLIGR